MGFFSLIIQIVNRFSFQSKGIYFNQGNFSYHQLKYHKFLNINLINLVSHAILPNIIMKLPIIEVRHQPYYLGGETYKIDNLLTSVTCQHNQFVYEFWYDWLNENKLWKLQYICYNLATLLKILTFLIYFNRGQLFYITLFSLPQLKG